MLGGLSNTKPSDNEVEKLVNSVKDNFQELNYNTDKFEINSYKSQIVNGVNYFVKVETDKEFVHLKIHQELPHNNSIVTLIKCELEKKKEDEISYF